MLPLSHTQFPIFSIHVLRSGLKASRHYSDTCTRMRWDNMMNLNIVDPRPADFLDRLCRPTNHLGAGPSSHPSSLTINPAVLSPAVGPGVLLGPPLSLLRVCDTVFPQLLPLYIFVAYDHHGSLHLLCGSAQLGFWQFLTERVS